MKKNLLIIASVISLLTACEKNDSKESVVNHADTAVDMSDFYIPNETDLKNDAKTSGRSENSGSHCHSMEVLSRQIKEDPSLYNKMYNVEYHTRKFLKNQEATNNLSRSYSDNLGVINIPVYVHVVYSNRRENISDRQIKSQIDALNRDYRKKNRDVRKAPREFARLASDIEITFTLAKVFRHRDRTGSWSTNNAVKYKYPPITPETHLNIWVCTLQGNTLGYAQFPGGDPRTDGVVISPSYFGTKGRINSYYNLGRTGTHEVGHYLGLRHIWGDGGCQQDDFVSDTPLTDTANSGCPRYPTRHCGTADMTMNYMDYTYDRCMYMFTHGQKSRMRASFAPGGPRARMARRY